MTTRKPRQRKTPRQRAEEALAIAERAVTRTEEKAKQLRGEWETARAEYEAARRRRDFLAQSPDLADDTLPVPEQDPTPQEEK